MFGSLALATSAGPVAFAQDDEAVEGEEVPAGATSTALVGELDIDGDAVEGVTITVTDAAGAGVGSDETGDDGSWAVQLPSGGDYTATLDEGSLPEDVFVEGNSSVSTTVLDGATRTIIFRVTDVPPEEGTAPTGPSTFDEVVDRGVDGLRLGMVIALSALGLSLIYGVTSLINFAQGELVTFGAIAAWYLNVSAGINLIAAALIAVLLSALFGGGLDRGLFAPLRRRGLSPIALIVVSIGLSLFLRHLYLLVFGGAPESYEQFTIQSAFTIGPVSMTPKEFWIIVIGGIVVLLFALMLQKTRLGMSLRAVADNKDLAQSSGINVERVILYTWLLGAGIAGLGGIFLGLTEKVEWDMGFKALLLIFAAVVVGGLGTAYGPILGGLLLGVIIQVSTIWFDVEFKLVFALLALVVMLLVRPQGILGRRERVG